MFGGASADDRHVALLTAADSRKHLHAALFEPSGKQLWSAELVVSRGAISPYIVMSPFEPIVVVGSTKSLRSFDRATGKPTGAAGEL
jgi:hypothetical protein